MSESKENNKAEELKDENVEHANESTSQVEGETVEAKKEMTLEEKYKDINDKYLRLYAEFENFRRRTNKEKVDIISSANAGVITDMLPVLDDFERAIANNDKIEDIEVMKEGFHLIFNKLLHILTSKGLKPMEIGQVPFDSELHEAVANIPAPDESLKGKVIDAVEKGYYLNDKVIRYAKVVVGQ